MALLAPRQMLSALALLTAGLSLSAVPADAGPLGAHRTPDDGSAVIRVHDWDDDDYDDYYGRRYYKRGTYVRAPFTRVYTRGYRHTSVDAPFASVRVRRSGTWVRAPFVNIYVPRY